MGDLSDLLARVEAADGPDMELDADLYLALVGSNIRSWDMPPEPTNSIDAALALVEEKLPGCAIDMRLHEDDAQAVIATGALSYKNGDGVTLPLAVLSALLRALISQQSASQQSEVGDG